MDDLSTFQSRLQEDVADRIGIPREQYLKFEKAYNSNPKIESIVKAAEALGYNAKLAFEPIEPM